MSLSSFQLLTMVKVGSKDETQLTTAQKVINKSLWLIGTSRNAILVVICGYVGYNFESTDAIKLTGEHHMNALYTLQPLYCSRYIS
jgi:sodium-independent sulfate anion transporter 11